jgi:hypothetical protein
MNHDSHTYQGFEQGPIRPPSEAYSLLLRVTQNCPWNRCTFCPVYKGSKFSIRPVDQVKRDIDSVAKHLKRLRIRVDEENSILQADIRKIIQDTPPEDLSSFQAAFHWLFRGGMKSIFLQDANSLVIKPSDLVEILNHLKKRFPETERITSYARSHTIARMKGDDLKAIGAAGLNRLHIGLESGSDAILKMVKKGSTKEMHIRAGLNVRRAGIELSEYIMPGLGGRELSEENALETADALNQINPDFIRLRTLGIPNQTPLYETYRQGHFQKCTDVEVVREILTFTENLDGITSFVTSDHILNLLAEFEGKLPDDKERMIGILREFLAMKPTHQRLYQVGRRLGIFSCIQDMDDPMRLAKAERAYREIGITRENADEITDELMKRFI